MAIGQTLQDKFNLNPTTGDPPCDPGRPQLGLRISRLNHDCDPNAGYNYCDASRVQILYANRDILKGEEICISYLITSTWRGPLQWWALKAHSGWSNNGWRTNGASFVPRNCFCNDGAIKKLVVKARKLNVKIERNTNPNSSWISIMNTHYTSVWLTR